MKAPAMRDILSTYIQWSLRSNHRSGVAVGRLSLEVRSAEERVHPFDDIDDHDGYRPCCQIVSVVVRFTL